MIRPIDSKTARTCVERWHYSGKAYPKSQIHFGVYWRDKLAGALSFGDPLDRRRVLPLVRDTAWAGMTELNRMALSPDMPRNAESRAIAVCLRILKKHAPQLEWVLSYADGAQCGDGTIYRASGWWLTQIKVNSSLWRTPGGAIFSDVGMRTSPSMQTKARAWLEDVLVRAVSPAELSSASTWREAGLEPLPGYMLRYIYPLNETIRDRLTTPILPYSAIDAAGARMYKGVALSRSEAAAPTAERPCKPDQGA
jgi:hypothetical protein